MGTGGDEIGDGGPGVATGDEGLPHEDGVGARAGELDDVVRATHPGLRDADDRLGDARGESGERASVDVQRAKTILADLVRRGVLEKTSQAERGPRVEYGPGPNFPRKARARARRQER